MGIRIDTQRLLLRPFAVDDVEHLTELHNDPEVMRFLNGGKPTPAAVIRNETLPRFLAQDKRFAASGYWAAVEKSTEAFLGWLHLRPADEHPPDEVELGYRLHVAAWGKGYATEGSRALINMGFTEFGVRRVYATTMAVNLASRRVMEKSGLTFVRTFHQAWPDHIPGGEHGDVEYELTRAGWEHQHPG